MGESADKADVVNEEHGANFDSIARPYRLLEYLALGPLLERTRKEYLSRLHDRRRALLLGDGDGRFLAALLAVNRSLLADAVDTSEAMLSLLRGRTSLAAAVDDGEKAARPSDRVRTHCQNALTYRPDFAPDLVVTHFFFDCLLQEEVDRLVGRLACGMTEDGMWLVSEFRIPPGRAGVFARYYVRLLYLAFRVLTGLRTKRLPGYGRALARAGLVRVAYRRRMFGLLTSELWQKGG